MYFQPALCGLTEFVLQDNFGKSNYFYLEFVLSLTGFFITQVSKMTDSCLVILCGLPAVGKSTFASNIAEARLGSLLRRSSKFWQQGVQLDEWRSDIHAIHVCYDEIIPEGLYSKDIIKDIKLDTHTNNSSQETDSYQMDDTKEWKKQRKFVSLFVEYFISSHSECRDTVIGGEGLKLNEQLDCVYRRLNRKHVCNCWNKMIQSRRLATLNIQSPSICMFIFLLKGAINFQIFIVVMTFLVTNLRCIYAPPTPTS